MESSAWNGGTGLPPDPLFSDEELAARFQAGDEAAFDELFRRYNQKLCTYLAYVTGDDDVGRQLAGDVCVKLYYQLPVNVAHVRAWLYRVGYNAALDYKKQKWRITRWEDYSEDMIVVEGPEKGVEQMVEAELIKMAMQNIPQKYRGSLYLYFVEGMTQTEIATCLGIGERSVRRYIADGIKKLTQAYHQLENS